ncbi:hypothetical protein PRIPAC_75398 [Pristionchus pacificus]|uniref:Uncharacterized protein n=1 Tax=Pristionchus pacificus TaxID=54126 RepID=A0A2A6C5C8_PRIPA|nr:hypothetical protein PRIPAC_75184 [Pristionchus pacificus]KAF8386256.1 hypothetical protein PRIPAC_75398 [Pristionchus pacificus]|eukprot:PDM73422.1 hypothetical protein PRIPAC_40778 [Pristionchus pacificus]
MASSLFFGLLFVSVIAVFVAADTPAGDAAAQGGNQAASTDGQSGGLMGAVTNAVKAFVQVPMSLIQQYMTAFNNIVKTFTDALTKMMPPPSSGAPSNGAPAQ